MNRLERLFAISETIRHSGQRPVAARVLADRFDVSQRTIERDLASLREAGAPVVSEPGRHGGAVSLDAAATTVVALSSPQVTALLIAVASAGADAPYSDDARAGADLLLERLAPTTRAQVVELRSRIRGPVRPSKVSARVRRTVQEAVRLGRVVNITYIDAESHTTERSVEAVGFYNGSDGWYLNGWCELRQAGRIFRLDRIHSARLTKRSTQQRDVDEVLGWTPNDVASP
ncbi:MAG: helix-turn-helix transcriptional regulator [Ilumatobacter sp.]